MEYHKWSIGKKRKKKKEKAKKEKAKKKKKKSEKKRKKAKKGQKKKNWAWPFYVRPGGTGTRKKPWGTR